LMTHLKVDRFAVIGHSSGGPCAFAIGAVLGPQKAPAVMAYASDSEYKHPSCGANTDPMSKDVCPCGKLCAGCWLNCCIPCALSSCCECLCTSIQNAEKTAGEDHIPDMIKKEEMDIWNENGGDNFFRHSVQQANKYGVGKTMAGFKHDIRIERTRRWDFSVKDIKSRVEIWSGELDDATVEAARFNHSQMPKSNLKFIPNRGHLGVLHQKTLETAVDHMLDVMAQPA